MGSQRVRHNWVIFTFTFFIANITSYIFYNFIGCIKLISIYFHKMNVYIEIYIHQRHRYMLLISNLLVTEYIFASKIYSRCVLILLICYKYIFKCIIVLFSHTHFVACILKFDEYNTQNKTQKCCLNVNWWCSVYSFMKTLHLYCMMCIIFVYFLFVGYKSLSRNRIFLSDTCW